MLVAELPVRSFLLHLGGTSSVSHCSPRRALALDSLPLGVGGWGVGDERKDRRTEIAMSSAAHVSSSSSS